MRKKMIILSTAIIAGLSGCGNNIPQLPSDTSIPASHGDFVYHGHNFGPNRSQAYREGVIAGCRTSDGEYTKNHARFNSSFDYYHGWEHGRMHCKGASHNN